MNLLNPTHTTTYYKKKLASHEKCQWNDFHLNQGAKNMTASDPKPKLIQPSKSDQPRKRREVSSTSSIPTKMFVIHENHDLFINKTVESRISEGIDKIIFDEDDTASEVSSLLSEDGLRLNHSREMCKTDIENNRPCYPILENKSHDKISDQTFRAFESSDSNINTNISINTHTKETKSKSFRLQITHSHKHSNRKQKYQSELSHPNSNMNMRYNDNKIKNTFKSKMMGARSTTAIEKRIKNILSKSHYKTFEDDITTACLEGKDEGKNPLPRENKEISYEVICSVQNPKDQLVKQIDMPKHTDALDDDPMSVHTDKIDQHKLLKVNNDNSESKNCISDTVPLETICEEAQSSPKEDLSCDIHDKQDTDYLSETASEEDVLLAERNNIDNISELNEDSDTDDHSMTDNDAIHMSLEDLLLLERVCTFDENETCDENNSSDKIGKDNEMIVVNNFSPNGIVQKIGSDGESFELHDVNIFEHLMPLDTDDDEGNPFASKEFSALSEKKQVFAEHPENKENSSMNPLTNRPPIPSPPSSLANELLRIAGVQAAENIVASILSPQKQELSLDCDEIRSSNTNRLDKQNSRFQKAALISEEEKKNEIETINIKQKNIEEYASQIASPKSSPNSDQPTPRTKWDKSQYIGIHDRTFGSFDDNFYAASPLTEDLNESGSFTSSPISDERSKDSVVRDLGPTFLTYENTVETSSSDLSARFDKIDIKEHNAHSIARSCSKDRQRHFKYLKEDVSEQGYKNQLESNFGTVKSNSGTTEIETTSTILTEKHNNLSPVHVSSLVAALEKNENNRVRHEVKEDSGNLKPHVSFSVEKTKLKLNLPNAKQVSLQNLRSKGNLSIGSETSKLSNNHMDTNYIVKKDLSDGILSESSEYLQIKFGDISRVENIKKAVTDASSPNQKSAQDEKGTTGLGGNVFHKRKLFEKNNLNQSKISPQQRTLTDRYAAALHEDTPNYHGITKNDSFDDKLDSDNETFDSGLSSITNPTYTSKLNSLNCNASYRKEKLPHQNENCLHLPSIHKHYVRKESAHIEKYDRFNRISSKDIYVNNGKGKKKRRTQFIHETENDVEIEEISCSTINTGNTSLSSLASSPRKHILATPRRQEQKLRMVNEYETNDTSEIEKKDFYFSSETTKGCPTYRSLSKKKHPGVSNIIRQIENSDIYDKDEVKRMELKESEQLKFEKIKDMTQGSNAKREVCKNYSTKDFEIQGKNECNSEPLNIIERREKQNECMANIRSIIALWENEETGDDVINACDEDKGPLLDSPHREYLHQELRSAREQLREGSLKRAIVKHSKSPVLQSEIDNDSKKRERPEVMHESSRQDTDARKVEGDDLYEFQNLRLSSTQNSDTNHTRKCNDKNDEVVVEENNTTNPKSSIKNFHPESSSFPFPRTAVPVSPSKSIRPRPPLHPYYSIKKTPSPSAPRHSKTCEEDKETCSNHMKTSNMKNNLDSESKEGKKERLYTEAEVTAAIEHAVKLATKQAMCNAALFSKPQKVRKQVTFDPKGKPPSPSLLAASSLANRPKKHTRARNSRQKIQNSQDTKVSVLRNVFEKSQSLSPPYDVLEDSPKAQNSSSGEVNNRNSLDKNLESETIWKRFGWNKFI